MTGEPIFIQPPEYPVLGSAFLHKLHKIGVAVRCLCCGATHIHVMFDSTAPDAKDEIGRAKQFASLKLESRPGRVFAKDCSVEEAEGVGHARKLWKYILNHEFKEGAWVWRYDKCQIPTREEIKRLQIECKRELQGRRV